MKRIVEIPVTDGPHETPEILEDGIPFVSAEAIKQDHIDFDRKRGFISIEDHKKYSQKYRPRRDDILMIKSGATTGNLAIVETDEEFNIWSPLAVVRVNREKANARYILSAMNSKEFQTSVQLFWSFGTQQNIGMNVIENLVVPFPPLREQQVIATYLDEKTRKIDTLIEKKRRLIELLKEQRTASIYQAVTKGINPNVKMKDSGIEWIGEIPEHWGVTRIKYLADFVNGYAFSSEIYTEIGVPLIRIGEVKPVIDLDNAKRVPSHLKDELSQFLVRKGDILIALTGYLGQATRYEYDEEALLNQRVGIVRPSSSSLCDNSFLFFVIDSVLFKTHLALEGKGSAQDNIGKPEVGCFPVPLPPFSEQQAITKHIDNVTNQINSAMGQYENQVNVLQEYRTALISEVVTGKIDVREFVSGKNN